MIIQDYNLQISTKKKLNAMAFYGKNLLSSKIVMNDQPREVQSILHVPRLKINTLNRKKDADWKIIQFNP
jgi:hypothetical protein